MLVVFIIVEVLLMIALPVALVFFLRRRWRLPWIIMLVGILSFIGSQVVHIPLNIGLTSLFSFEWMPKPPSDLALPFNAVVLGLTAGLCEESARYLLLRFWLTKARGWREAVWFGAGHGGIEAIITGVLVVTTLVSMIALRNLDISQLPVPPEQQALAAKQIAEFWSTPLYMPILAVLERVMAVILHLALSTLVMHGLIEKKIWTLFVAIGLHTLFNALAVYAAVTWGAVAAEGVLVVFTLGCIGILWATWKRALPSMTE